METGQGSPAAPGRGEPHDVAAKVAPIVIVAALGYFVDIYDLILFGAVRRPSLIDLGVPPAALLDEGVFLFNVQMIGMLLGGILWGVLGDKRGRLTVLFGSIITYSLANLANGFVHGLDSYAVCRFIAGVGLAGELGAGICLVSEVMSRDARGWGTTIVATVGICGGVAATLIGGAVPQITDGVHWRTAYFIGGGLGLALLVLRIGVVESGAYRRLARTSVSRGNFFALFKTWDRARRYLGVIAIGVPIWFVIGILITFADVFGQTLGLDPAPRPATALFCCYAGAAVGDLGAGALSQLVRSRRLTFAIFLSGMTASVVFYLTFGGMSAGVFYGACVALGLTSGYWAVFVSNAAEQFGTNLRATVTTTAPNFVRGSAVLATMGFQALRPAFGNLGAAAIGGAVALSLAVIALIGMRETFGRDLEFNEEEP